jgi:alanyl-tRNA synthetase
LVFKIVSEETVAAGIRRMKQYGDAVKSFTATESLLSEIKMTLKNLQDSKAVICFTGG